MHVNHGRFRDTQVNPSILGGIIVDFGDKSIDLSVASRVTKLNNLLQRMSIPRMCLFSRANNLCRVRLMSCILHRVFTLDSALKTSKHSLVLCATGGDSHEIGAYTIASTPL